jgi:hypothetical protein
MPLAVLRAVVTFHLIAITWVFFRAKSIDDAWLILKKIGTRLADIPSLISRYPFTAEHALGASLIVLLLVVEILDERKSLSGRLAAAPLVMRWSVYYLVIFGLLILGRWQVKEFIYMQF